MKKKKLESLSLNKKSISNLKSDIVGGRHTKWVTYCCIIGNPEPETKTDS